MAEKRLFGDRDFYASFFLCLLKGDDDGLVVSYRIHFFHGVARKFPVTLERDTWDDGVGRSTSDKQELVSCLGFKNPTNTPTLVMSLAMAEFPRLFVKRASSFA